jgi:hypothetical protein
MPVNTEVCCWVLQRKCNRGKISLIYFISRYYSSKCVEKREEISESKSSLHWVFRFIFFRFRNRIRFNTNTNPNSQTKKIRLESERTIVVGYKSYKLVPNLGTFDPLINRNELMQAHNMFFTNQRLINAVYSC